MIKNKVYFSAFFLFSSFVQGFGITEALANRTIEIYNKFFTPGQNNYEGVLANLWPEFLRKLDSWSFTPSQSRPNEGYLIIGTNASKPLKYVLAEYFHGENNTIQSSWFRAFYNSKLYIFAQRNDLAFNDYHNLIVMLDQFIAKIERAGFKHNAYELFKNLKTLVSLDFIKVTRNQDHSAIRENNLKLLKKVSFSIIFFALTIQNGLFNGLNRDQRAELFNFVSYIADQTYPLDYEEEEENCSDTEDSDFDQ